MIRTYLKSPEEDDEAGELNKAQEILGMVLPADEDSTLPLHPGEEAIFAKTADQVLADEQIVAAVYDAWRSGIPRAAAAVGWEHRPKWCCGC